ncbi:MAG: hypothetical protein FWD25_07160 [Clostridia bacterium]|nr:hypothetical protein [Clostridia bacterium]
MFEFHFEMTKEDITNTTYTMHITPQPTKNQCAIRTSDAQCSFALAGLCYMPYMTVLQRSLYCLRLACFL